MSELEFDGKKAKLSYNSEINFKMSSLNVPKTCGTYSLSKYR